MAVQITDGGKNPLILKTPVMPAAGTFGFGDVYRGIVRVEKLGAIVTSPVTYAPWKPASGTRVIPLDSGVLVHTGLPNPGISRTFSKYRNFWDRLEIPVIMHVVTTSIEDVERCASRIDAEPSVEAMELGLSDDLMPDMAMELVEAAVRHTEKPVLVRLPLLAAYELADPVQDAGASALVVGGPPRGTARDPYSGRLVPGRVYGPLVKPIALRAVGHLARRVDIPIIGAGGIHSTQDARDYIEAGARAVQVDSVTWIEPNVLNMIALDLGGDTVTQPAGALPDEWYPGMGDDTYHRRQRSAHRPQDD